MRFFKDGPSIPDNLLIARDEGRVVFFCGAGVSRERASLPDFFNLAEDVILKLRVSPDNPASKILNDAQDLEKRIGPSGLISVDRIFGLLERDFLVHEIWTAVAEALKPSKEVDLSAHQILLNLATTQEGKVQLVTTNFDRLFEVSCDSLNISYPPRLPDPSRSGNMNGIVHLHGCVTEDYTGAEGDGFILSSSEFGRAYLSDGWATNFFKEIIERYVVVFVGYTADDPPVQYLLEGLNKKASQLYGVYAFQSDRANDAVANWLHKGVKAITYTENNGHRVLWETLSAWAERAKDPDEWYKSVINISKKGPDQLQPYERGQVAHIISTTEGARKFSESDVPPPAEWLCVFDPCQRYAKQEYIEELGEQKLYVDPFELYGLDSDTVPKKMDPNSHYEKRNIPSEAWDGFAMDRLDQQNLSDDSFSAIRSRWATNVPILPSRLYNIGTWITKVADQPTAVWWSARQYYGLHPDIQKRIQRQLEHSKRDNIQIIRKAWRYLFEAWEENRRNFNIDNFELKRVIEKDGWDNATIRKFATVNRPYLKVRNYSSINPKPPKWKNDINIKDMLVLNVEYPVTENDIKIPDEWLALIVREIRKNLEHAWQLESEVSSYKPYIRSPIIEDYCTENIFDYDRTHGLSGNVIFFWSLFERLIELDIASAKQEFNSWAVIDDKIFTRLRILASGKSELVSAQTCGSIIAKMSDDVFWDSYNQRDFLLVLAKRWQGLSELTRKEIENRLLQGITKIEGEDDAIFEEHRAWETLNRLHWLSSNGCKFTFDLEEETKKLQSSATKWKPEYAKKTAESMECRSVMVETETNYVALLDEPLDNILTKARELSGSQDNFLVDKDPFAGLSADKPIRAFSALTNAAKRGEYPEWAWHTFLNFEARRNDKSKFSAYIAERLSRYPDDVVVEFIHPASSWLHSKSKDLLSSYPQSFYRIMSKFINVFRTKTLKSNSAIIRNKKEPDWIMESINSPVGKVTQALMNGLGKNGLKSGYSLSVDWLTYANQLLKLKNDLRRYVFVIFAFNINWFYNKDPHWTEANILSVLDKGDKSDQFAIWSGFFWSANLPSESLYMRMKQNLLVLAKQRGLPHRRHGEVLATIILAGWGLTHKDTEERYISKDEIHDVLLYTNDEFHQSILRRVKWWSEDKNSSKSEKWSVLLIELLRDVWPRQKSVKTPKVSLCLCKLAFSSVEHFPTIAKIVLPLLTTIDCDYAIFSQFDQSLDSIVHLHPRPTLDILHAILPDNVAIWPYGTDTILNKLGEADKSLRSDEKFLELNRKWNSR